MTTPDRTPVRILAELAEVRRHLHDTPPHHGGGRATLERRVTELEAELARTRRLADADSARAPRPPAGSAPD